MTTGTTTTTLTPAQQTYSAELDAIEARSRLVIGEGVGAPNSFPGGKLSTLIVLAGLERTRVGGGECPTEARSCAG
jgi:hypothetical protein